MTDAPRSRMDPAGIAGAVFCCVLWGGNAVAVKFAVPDLPPFGLAALRFLVGLPIVAVACRWLGQPLRVPRNHLPVLMAHAALTVLQIGTFNWGTGHSLAGRSSVFINIHPLIVAPLAWPLLGERLGWRGALGLAGAALGVAALLARPAGQGGSIVGDVVVLGSGVVFALQTIAQKKTFPIIPPTTLLFGQTLLAIPAFLLYSGLFEGFATYRFTPEATWAVLFQGLAVSGACFSLWMVLLRRYPAGRLAAIAFLTPIFGVALGGLARGEAITPPLLVGGLLVGLGIYLVSSDRAAHGDPPPIALPGEDAP